MTIEDRALIFVLKEAIAKMMVKTYGVSLEDALDDLEKNTKLKVREMKRSAS